MNLLPASALIPTLNAAATLPATLAALRGSVAEIIIADGGSTDRTREIASEHGALVIPAARGRGVQLRAAAEGGPPGTVTAAALLRLEPRALPPGRPPAALASASASAVKWPRTSSSRRS